MMSTRDALLRALNSRAIVYPELNTNLFVTGDTFAGQDLSYLQLRRAVFDGTKFSKCNFELSMLQGVSLQHCVFDHCKFTRTDSGTGITLVGAVLKNTVFKDIFGDWTFSDCKMMNCEFKSLDGAMVVFDRGTELTACNLCEVDIESAHDAFVRTKSGDEFMPWPADEDEDDDDDDEEDEDEADEDL